RRGPHVAVQEPAVDIVRIFIVQDRIADKHVYATEPIDQLDQALKSDPDVFVDVDVEVSLHGGDGGGCATVSVGGIDLRAAACREWHPEVAGDGEHGDVLAGRVDPDQDHRLGQRRLVLAIVVGTK